MMRGFGLLCLFMLIRTAAFVYHGSFGKGRLSSNPEVVANTLFGLRINFWMAIVTRFLLGCLNDVHGPIKAYSEIVHDEYQALALSTA
ncbi:hypothetical protein OROHE_009668 [Orobanche hederae]